MHNFPPVSMPATEVRTLPTLSTVRRWFGRFTARSGLSAQNRAAFAQENHAFPVNLYVAFAEQELGDDDLPSVTAFVDTLKQRSYVGFTFTYETIPTCTHGGALPGAYSAGLYTVFG